MSLSVRVKVELLATSRAVYSLIRFNRQRRALIKSSSDGEMLLRSGCL